MAPSRWRFRAWDPESRKMYLDIQDAYDGFRGLPEDSFGLFLGRENSYRTPRKEYVVMQSTGLLDKNGKEIFEGDVLQDEYCAHCRAAVTFEDARFMWDCGGEWGEIVPEHVIVIGNIYEHPHLLTESSDSPKEEK